MTRTLLTIPNRAYTRLARNNETKKVTAVVMLVNKPLKLVSPAVNWCGDCVEGVTNDPVDWLDKFFAACPGCKVDYIAVHSYAPGSESLRNYLTKFKKYNKPLWITEFAPWDPPKPDFEGVVRYMKEAIPILENDPDVFR